MQVPEITTALVETAPSFAAPVVALATTLAGGVLTALATWIGAPSWSRRRRVLAIAAGTLLAALLGAALARPSRDIEEVRERLRVLVLEDGSSSRAGERELAVERALAWEATLPGGFDAIVSYGSELRIWRGSGLRSPELAQALKEHAAAPLAGLRNGAGASAAAALLASLAAEQSGLEALWIASGREAPSASASARRLASRGVDLDVALTGSDLVDARPTELRFPASVRALEPFQVELVAELHGLERASFEILVLPAGQLASDTDPGREALGRSELELTAPDSRGVTDTFELEPGEYDVLARTMTGDDISHDDRLARRLIVRDRPHALIIRERPVPPPDDWIARALDYHGFTTEVARPSQAPLELTSIASADVIVLDDLLPDAVGAETVVAIAEQVRERGAGLFMVAGGDEADRSPWSQGALGELLPVRFQAPEPEPEDTAASDTEESGDEPGEPDLEAEPERVAGKVARAGVVLCIDRSGSMDGQKLDMAVMSAIQAARAMQGEDEIAVIAFDSIANLALPFTQASEHPKIRGILTQLAAGGSTNIYKALKASYDLIEPRMDDFAVRHVILMTDGHSMTGGDYDRIVEKMNRAKITTTMIGIGPDYDRSLLGRIAWKSGGRVESALDFDRLPALVQRDVAYAIRLRQDPADRDPQGEPEEPGGADETGGTPAAASGDAGATAEEAMTGLAGDLDVEVTRLAQIVTGLGGEDAPFPRVRAPCRVELQTGAEQVLEARAITASPGEAAAVTPLLALAPAGRGRALALMVDLAGEGTAEWALWPHTGKFIAQCGRALTPVTPPGSSRLALDVVAVDESSTVIEASLVDSAGVEVSGARLVHGDSEWTTAADGRARLQALTPAPGEISEFTVTAVSAQGVELSRETVLLSSPPPREIETLDVERSAWKEWVFEAGGRLDARAPTPPPPLVEIVSASLVAAVLAAAALILPLLAFLRRSGS